MSPEIYLSIVLAFMIAGALIAVETKNLLSSAISIGAVGFGLSVSFLFLRAPDLAIVQVAVEVVLLVFLIRATISRDTIPVKGHISWAGLVPIVLISACFLAITIIAVPDLPEFGHPVTARIADAPSNTYLAEAGNATGSRNVVTAILLDYRAYDTLGEATVLFAAVIGALSVLRGKARPSKGKQA